MPGRGRAPADAAAASERALAALWRDTLNVRRQALEHLPEDGGDEGGLSPLELLGGGASADDDDEPPPPPPPRRGKDKPAAAPAAAPKPKKPCARARARPPLQLSEDEDSDAAARPPPPPPARRRAAAAAAASDDDDDEWPAALPPAADDPAARRRREEEERQHVAINATMARDIERQSQVAFDAQLARELEAARSRSPDPEAAAEAAATPPPKRRGKGKARAADGAEDGGASFSGRILHERQRVDPLAQRRSQLQVAATVVEGLVPLGAPTTQRPRAQREADAKKDKAARINAVLGHPNKPWSAADPEPIDVQVRTALGYKPSRPPDPRGIGVERAMAIAKAVQTPGVVEALRTRSALGKRDWLPQPPPPLEAPAPRLKGQPPPAPGGGGGGGGGARARELLAQRRAVSESKILAADAIRAQRLAAFHASLAAR